MLKIILQISEYDAYKTKGSEALLSMPERTFGVLSMSFLKKIRHAVHISLATCVAENRSYRLYSALQKTHTTMHGVHHSNLKKSSILTGYPSSCLHMSKLFHKMNSWPFR